MTSFRPSTLAVPPRPRRERAEFVPAESDPLPAGIVRQVVRGLALGQFHPGERLPTEDELAQRFGVSRTVVREAMRVLAARGLVEVRQGSGTRIAAYERWHLLDPTLLFELMQSGRHADLVMELTELRRIFEGEAAALAATRRSEADLTRLAELCAAMTPALGDAEQFTALDVAFHDTVLAASHNRLLREALRPLTAVLYSARLLTNRHYIAAHREGARASLSGHRRIRQRIALGQPDAARRAMIAHIAQFEADLQRSIGAPQRGSPA
jgi:GntR family transcriptional regulator, galactonate operon transcriptional repressor